MIAKRVLVGAAVLIGLGAPIVGRTQASAKVHRIGLLANGSAEPRMPAPVEALREALRDLGLVEGRTIEIEYRWAEGRVERLPELAAELVRAKVDLIVAAGDAPTRAAMAATRAIPIVMATSGDAVGAGFVASLSRPGGNVTGMTAINPELGAKRLQLLHELRPKATSVAALLNPGDESHALDLKATQAAASGLGVSLQAFDLRSTDEVDSVLEAREWAAAGGLLAYGVTHVDLFRQSALHVDKILKGAKPADLPVEQPTRIRLTVNLKAARVLGVAIPQSLLLRADEVLE